MSAALPPLVGPGADLTAAELERYSRHILLPEIGAIGQRRLKNARVLVVGAGGLGSPVLLYLAAAGLGTLGIVDDDIVDLSNLQRQVIHGLEDVGRSKLESAAAAVAGLNPLVTVRLHHTRLDRTNALELFADYDLIVDGSDNFATRYLVNDAAEILAKPCVWGSVSRFDGQVSLFWAEHGPTYRDLYPDAPPAGSAPSCGEGGVFGMLCGAVGAMMVSEAVKLITGAGRTLLGRVLLFDALGPSWRELTVSRDPAGQPVTELVDYERFCGTSPAPDADCCTEAGTQRGTEASLTVRELAALLAARSRGEQDFDLIDVREPGEHQIVRIPGSLLIPLGRILSGEDLRRDRDLVLYCKAGTRSADALAELRRRGYSRAKRVVGGMLAWVNEIDPTGPRY